MPTNLLKAIKNIYTYHDSDLRSYTTKYLIRINAVGDQLEYYLKDSLAGSFKLPLVEKEKEYSNFFSYFGNQNNPPDIIIKESDAYEIKKIEGGSGALALNSSPPKDRLWVTDSRITSFAKKCESKQWESKDLFYVIGHVGSGNIKHLFFVHGLCYAASKEVYDRIAMPLKKNISNAIALAGLDEGKGTNELGRINRVDPLGITNLRIRGMWTIENPRKVFSYAYQDKWQNFNLVAIMTEDKYRSFPKEDIDSLESDNAILVKEANIKNPNNPAQTINSIIISLGW